MTAGFWLLVQQLLGMGGSGFAAPPAVGIIVYTVSGGLNVSRTVQGGLAVSHTMRGSLQPRNL